METRPFRSTLLTTLPVKRATACSSGASPVRRAVSRNRSVRSHYDPGQHGIAWYFMGQYGRKSKSQVFWRSRKWSDPATRSSWPSEIGEDDKKASCGRYGVKSPARINYMFVKCSLCPLLATGGGSPYRYRNILGEEMIRHSIYCGTGLGTPQGTSARRPVSRVLSQAEGPRDGHSSGTPVTGRLARPTRAAGPGNRPGSDLATAPRRPYLVLLPEGFAMPHPLPGARCALTAPFHPCSPALRPRASGLLSVALSLGSPPPGVTRLRASVEPGLSSAARLGRRRRPSGRLARLDYACHRARSSHSQRRPAASASTSWSTASVPASITPSTRA